MTSLADLVAGASYPLRAARLMVRSPALWSYVLVPVTVTLLVAAVAYVALLGAGFRLVDALTGGLPEALGPLRTLLRLLLATLLLVGAPPEPSSTATASTPAPPRPTGAPMPPARCPAELPPTSCVGSSPLGAMTRLPLTLSASRRQS